VGVAGAVANWAVGFKGNFDAGNRGPLPPRLHGHRGTSAGTTKPVQLDAAASPDASLAAAVRAHTPLHPFAPLRVFPRVRCSPGSGVPQGPVPTYAPPAPRGRLVCAALQPLTGPV
jgi:hypothetical protein